MSYKLKFLLFTILCISISSCGNEDDGITIDEALEVHFESFKQEAASRGITVDYELEEISGFIGNIGTGGVIGQCTRNSDQTKTITIDRFFWATYDFWEKEMVIYHELGHCFLNRDHIDDINNDGTCFSIMHSSEDICDNNYTEDTREGYIDELFK